MLGFPCQLRSLARCRSAVGPPKGVGAATQPLCRKSHAATLIVLIRLTAMPCPEPWGRQCDGATERGKAIKARRRKAATPQRFSAPKVSGRRNASSTNAGTTIASLKRERDEALEQLSAAS